VIFIKHPQFKDVCFEVQNSLFDAAFEGYWWNMGYVSSWKLNNKKETIVVCDILEWQYCANPKGACLRYERWL